MHPTARQQSYVPGQGFAPCMIAYRFPADGFIIYQLPLLLRLPIHATGEDDKVYWAFAWLILMGHDSLSIRRLFTALRAHSDTAFIPRHSLYIHASLIIKGTVGLEPTFLPDFFLPCSPFELRSPSPGQLPRPFNLRPVWGTYKCGVL